MIQNAIEANYIEHVVSSLSFSSSSSVASGNGSMTSTNVASTRSITSDDVDSINSSTRRIANYDRSKKKEETGENLGTCVRFVHDKILEASLSLFANDRERILLRNQIGHRLLKVLTSDEVESELFLITDLLDQGPSTSDAAYSHSSDHDHRDLFLRMNLRASEKAKSLSAFSNALKYALKGLALLSTTPLKSSHSTNDLVWNANAGGDFVRTQLRLYSVGAEAAAIVGKVEELRRLSDVVLPRTDVSVLDKLRIYNALLDSMASQGQLSAAQALVCELLPKLGCKVPNSSNPFHAVRTLVGLSKLRRKPPTKQQIERVPREMTDANHRECLRLLYQLQTFTYLNRDVPLFLWSCLKQIKLTMKHGLHELSATAFPAMGAIMVALYTDFQTGTLFARHGRLILDLGGDKHKIAVARVAFSCIIAPSYYQPMQSLIKGLSESHKAGMQMGDTDSAMWCLGHRCWLQFMTGRSLPEVEADCRVSVNRMKVLNRKEAVHFASPVWQMTLNLMGSSPHTTQLVGEAFGMNSSG